MRPVPKSYNRNWEVTSAAERNPVLPVIAALTHTIFVQIPKTCQCAVCARMTWTLFVSSYPAGGSGSLNPCWVPCSPNTYELMAFPSAESSSNWASRWKKHFEFWHHDEHRHCSWSVRQRATANPVQPRLTRIWVLTQLCELRSSPAALLPTDRLFGSSLHKNHHHGMC